MATCEYKAVTSYSAFAAYADNLSKPASFYRRFMLTFEAAKQRRHLARLDAHLLEDIGVSAENAATEVQRPAWDIPTRWMF